MKRLHKVILAAVGIGLAVPLVQNGIRFHNKPQAPTAAEVELAYYKQASRLNDMLFREGVPARTSIIVDVLKAIDRKLPVYFPSGPFRRSDLIAMAWLESEFRQYEVGTHSEKGIFQIMPGEFKDFNVHKNYYDVDLNTEMAFRVLNIKFQKHGDYRKSIMAYNGLVHFHNGHYSDKYWKAFEKRKVAVDLILAER